MLLSGHFKIQIRFSQQTLSEIWNLGKYQHNSQTFPASWPCRLIRLRYFILNIYLYYFYTDVYGSSIINIFGQDYYGSFLLLSILCLPYQQALFLMLLVRKERQANFIHSQWWFLRPPKLKVWFPTYQNINITANNNYQIQNSPILLFLHFNSLSVVNLVENAV